MARTQRREYTSRGADPTVMVEWKVETDAGTVTLTEFQGIVAVEADVRGPSRELADDVLLHQLGETLHSALEHAYAADQELACVYEEDR